MKITGRIPGKADIFNIEYEKGTLTLIEPVKDPDVEKTNTWISPGLFDIQVNGMMGHDLNAEGLTTEKIAGIENGLEKHGITKWCPTITTQDTSIVIENLKVINKAIEEKSAPNIACIHLEGHYISSEEGFRGVHDPKYIRDPDKNEFDSWQNAAGGHIGYFSIAPERKGAIDFIKKLSGEGVRVGLVHHNADYETIKKAVNAGASIATHLVNGCAHMIQRQRNPIWAQLSLDELWASFIADGHHIPPYTLKAVIRSKSIERSILTSDLDGLSGLPEGEYDKWGMKIVHKDGGLWVKDRSSGLLAGAAKTLDKQVEYCAQNTGFTIGESLRMASLNPAQFFKMENEFALYPGRKGKIVLFEWDNTSLTVRKILE